MNPNDDALSSANQHLSQAYLHVDNGNLTQALNECDLALATNPHSAEAHNLRGIILDRQGQSELAAQAYRAAVSIEPGFQEAVDNLHELESEMASQFNLVAIAAFCTPDQVHEIKQQLAAHGIWTVITQERETGFAGLMWGSLRGMKLQVREQDSYRALTLLGVQPTRSKVKRVKSTQPRCPDCHSADLRYERYSKWGIYGSWRRERPKGRCAEKKWRCQACDYEWTEQEE